ncbi:hypothetical protein LDO31_08970 [Luteimonas sp. XNQY3]|nr:hypothetical protein [Luteimonas sp. XNQY3]MCD9006364.1 hypothetical protein [Luteimonas sp. XNQY3]
MRIPKTLVLAGVIGLGGCTSQQEYRADSGYPYPAWCAELERQVRDTPPPKSRERSRNSLPPQCREATTGIRFGGVSKPARTD